MRKTLALLLLSPLVISEELEYPIELTCEIGAAIYFIQITTDESWIEQANVITDLKRNQNKKFQAKVKIYDKDLIIVQAKTKGLEHKSIVINRNSLGAETNFQIAGQCYQGLKKYSKKF